MIHCYRALLLCIALLIFLKFVLLQSSESLVDDAAISKALRSNDPETLLAAGRTLTLSQIGIYELELIPGISDSLATGINKHKTAIYKLARYMRPHERHRALMIVHGVGEKTARKLCSYVDPAR